MSRLHDAHVRRVSEAAATMPSFAVASTWDTVSAEELLARLRDPVPVWRDGTIEVPELRIAVALPGPVFPVLSHANDHAALRDRDPASFTAAELAGATFTVWGLDLGTDWLTPPPLPRQGAGLGVGRQGLTLVCDARAVTPEAAAALLSCATGRSGSGPRPS